MRFPFPKEGVRYQQVIGQREFLETALLTKLGLTPCCGLLKASKGSTGLTFSLAALTVLLIGLLPSTSGDPELYLMYISKPRF
jgi:hypothetical protein